MMDYVSLSKEISYALRHAPWEYELEMDSEGFVPIEQLLLALNEEKKYKKNIEFADIIAIIKISDKQRLDISGKKIRALYGHSIPMKIQKQETPPPDVLYHGTARQFVDSIQRKGLLPMKRQYVHLSCDVETATLVGKRRDLNPVILRIDAKRANADGIKFYAGNEKVWLCDFVLPKYIDII